MCVHRYNTGPWPGPGHGMPWDCLEVPLNLYAYNLVLHMNLTPIFTGQKLLLQLQIISLAQCASSLNPGPCQHRPINPVAWFV